MFRFRSRGAFVIALAAMVSLACPLWGAQNPSDDKKLQPPPSESFRVKLKSGEFLIGRVFDLGREKLEVFQTLGATTVAKRDVESMTRLVPASGAVTESPRILVLKNHQQLDGDISFDGVQWTVRRPAGVVRYSEDEVLRVIEPSGKCTDGAFTARRGFEAEVKKAIAQVRGDDVEARSAGMDLLERGAYFALRDIEMAREDGDPGGRLLRILLQQKRRMALPSDIELVLPGFVKALEEGDEVERTHVLREGFLERGVEIFPLLAVVLLDPEQPASVRALAVDVLQRMSRTKELVDAYQQAEGRAQLAVAIALGDGGIYVGIPTLIEALDLDEPEVRDLAASKLTEYTGEDFGYVPGADDNVRRTAQARWLGWWRRSKDDIEQNLAYKLRPDIANQSPQRVKAVQLWSDGSLYWEKRELITAKELFRKSSEYDPTYIPPIVALGILSYKEDGDYATAIELFERSIRRGDEERDASVLRLSYYHLGRIHQLGFDFDLASKAFRRAIDLDPYYADAWYHAGSCLYEAALRLKDASAEERRGHFEGAAETFATGLAKLREYREGLVVLTSNALPIGTELPFSRREHNRGLLQLRERLRATEAQFSYRIGVIRLALGESAAALAAAREAVASPKPEARFHHLLAQVLESMGELEDASAERTKAAALERDS